MDAYIQRRFGWREITWYETVRRPWDRCAVGGAAGPVYALGQQGICDACQQVEEMRVAHAVQSQR